MLELSVYYHDVLRYIIIANRDKVQELRDKGFDVRVNEAAGQRLGMGGWRPPGSLPVHRGIEVIVHHDEGFGMHKMAEVRPGGEHDTISFY